MGAFFFGILAASLATFLVIHLLLRKPTLSSTAKYARWLAVAASVGYGLLGRFFFGLGSLGFAEWPQSTLAVMSASFLFLIPVAVGFVSQVARDPGVGDRLPPVNRWFRAFLQPMLPVLMMLGLLSVFNIEGIICIAMAAPIFLLLAGIGGLIGYGTRRRTERKSRAGVISFMIFMPYLASPLEQRLTPPAELRQVQNRVYIRAAPEVVWDEIKSVPAIQRRELPFRFAHVIGLPRPIEATLSRDGVGGVRIATFERGLAFRETVTRWEPGHRLSFAIRAEASPAGALDAHVAVGGSYFDVTEGSYELEAVPAGNTLLTLTSQQRLSTGFNPYARLWSDFIMSDLQSAIMEVVRARSEQAHSSASIQ